MPRKAGSLLICSFLLFLLLKDEPLHAATQEEVDHLFRCANSKFIQFFAVCDGKDDCGDNSDERDCDYTAAPELLPFHCLYTNITYTCKRTNVCIPLEKFCDSVKDCPDGTDEYKNCMHDLHCTGKYKCKDGHCIRESWVCDGTKDCPDDSDEESCDASQRPASDCIPAKNMYLCKNKRCIPLDAVCNNADDCGDLSDEHNNCSSLCRDNCEHKCKRTPAGPVCVCEAGFELKNATSCEDIDECKTFGICDQLCENTKGSYKCSCKEDYKLQSDGKTCRAASQAEATLFFTDMDEIHGIFLESEHNFLEHEIQRNFIMSMTMNGDHIYWSNRRTIYLVDSKTNSDVKIVTVGPKNIQEMAVDWITGNLYFADWHDFIAVCTYNGSYCVELISGISSGHPIALALSPINGIMFVGFIIDKLEVGYITKADMDGTNKEPFVTSDLGYPCGITVDHGSDRVYWVDSKLFKIESIRLDGTDRRVLLENVQSGPVSISVFENYVYWSTNITTDIEYCNKFTGKNWKTLYHGNTLLRHLYISHSAARPKMKNPCHQNSCPELCLLNSNKSYTCACTSNKKFVGNMCLESRETENVIAISQEYFVHYYYGLIGMEKTVRAGDLMIIKEATCDPITGDIIAHNVPHLRVIRYNPRTGGITDLLSLKDLVQGMAIDHIGNNLITSFETDRTIEVYSMTTGKKTVFYFKDVPKSIAVVPEIGAMFVAFKNTTSSSCYIDRVPMDNTHARTRFILRNFNGDYRISLFYDRHTKKLFVGDYLSGGISSYDVEEFTHIDIEDNYSVGYKKLVSIAVTKQEVYWTEKNVNELYWKKKSDILKLTDSSVLKNVALILPVRQALPLVTVQCQLHSISKVGCRDNNGNCSHVCLPTSVNTYICACPPGMMLGANSHTCEMLSVCRDGEVRCTEHNICIKHEQWCNGYPDCPSSEDEAHNCKQSNNTCAHGQFKCKNGECVSLKSRCDLHIDCQDKSDEEDCVQQCKHDEFRCNNGRCIAQERVCDGWNDCIDVSDEVNCVNKTCSTDEFRCKSGHCIRKMWECDGEEDCKDGSDEHDNCTSAAMCTSKKMFVCANGNCVSRLLRCNGLDDCGDNTDEMLCANQTYVRHTTNDRCNPSEYRCNGTSICVSNIAVCDGVRNCPQGDDENACTNCYEEEFTCGDGQCIEKEFVCDTEDDCVDGSDEKNCYGNGGNTTSGCEEYTCSDDTCLPFSHLCDGFAHCHDGGDEKGECAKACTLLGNVTCEQICYKAPNGGICRCAKGYYLASDKTSCADVNECDHNICSQICRNSAGSYDCSCYEGYTLRPDNIGCRALGPPMQYILATYTNIKRLSMTFKIVDVIHEDTTVSQIDVNDVNGNVYWTSDYYGTLNKLDVTTSKIFTMKGFRPVSLAVDSITDNVYVSNGDNIEVCNVEQKKCATLITTEEEERIVKVIVDMHNRYLYWITHNDASEILRSDMLGYDDKIIVRDIGIANSLAIDSANSRLYWLRISQKVVESSDLDGYHRKTILYLKEPIFDMHIFENELYSFLNGHLTRCKLYGNKACDRVIVKAIEDGVHFAIQHTSKLPRDWETSRLDGNPCEKLNCTFMCVLRAQPTCICEDGTPVEVNRSCISDEEHSKNVGRQKGIIILLTLTAMLVIGLLYYCYQQELLKCWRRVRADNTILSFRNLLYEQNAENLVESVIVAESTTSSSSSNTNKNTVGSPGKHEYVNPLTSKVQPRPTRKCTTERTESMDSEEAEETLIKIDVVT